MKAAMAERLEGVRRGAVQEGWEVPKEAAEVAALVASREASEAAKVVAADKEVRDAPAASGAAVGSAAV